MHSQARTFVTEQPDMNVFEADVLHIPHLLLGAVTGDLRKKGLMQNTLDCDFQKPAMVRISGTVERQSIMLSRASIYIHGEPVQAHYRWVKENEVIERKLFGPETHQLMGVLGEFVRMPDTPWYLEQMLRGEEVMLYGRLERRLVIDAVCVNA